MKWLLIILLFSSCAFTRSTGAPGEWQTVVGNNRQAITKWQYSKWIKRNNQFIQYRINKYSGVTQKRYWND